MAEEFDNREDPVWLNGLRLEKHVVSKGFQLGTVVGLGLVMPIVAYRLRKTANGLNLANMLNAQGISALTGGVITGQSNFCLLKEVTKSLKCGFKGTPFTCATSARPRSIPLSTPHTFFCTCMQGAWAPPRFTAWARSEDLDCRIVHIGTLRHICVFPPL
jgi:hypothetical protein